MLWSLAVELVSCLSQTAAAVLCALRHTHQPHARTTARRSSPQSNVLTACSASSHQPHWSTVLRAYCVVRERSGLVSSWPVSVICPITALAANSSLKETAVLWHDALAFLRYTPRSPFLTQNTRVMVAGRQLATVNCITLIIISQVHNGPVVQYRFSPPPVRQLGIHISPVAI